MKEISICSIWFHHYQGTNGIGRGKAYNFFSMVQEETLIPPANVHQMVLLFLQSEIAYGPVARNGKVDFRVLGLKSHGPSQYHFYSYDVIGSELNKTYLSNSASAMLGFGAGIPYGFVARNQKVDFSRRLFSVPCIGFL